MHFQARRKVKMAESGNPAVEIMELGDRQSNANDLKQNTISSRSVSDVKVMNLIEIVDLNVRGERPNEPNQAKIESFLFEK